MIKNEFKEETVLSAALRYKKLGFDAEALLTLLVRHKSVKNELWKAFLYKDSKVGEIPDNVWETVQWAVKN